MPRLRRANCSGPGIVRRGRGRGVEYLGESGERIDDEEVLERIRELVIPPAWKDVWVCPHPFGHIGGGPGRVLEAPVALPRSRSPRGIGLCGARKSRVDVLAEGKTAPVTESCLRCGAGMEWRHQTWQCPRCRFKIGCCEGDGGCDADFTAEAEVAMTQPRESQRPRR